MFYRIGDSVMTAMLVLMFIIPMYVFNDFNKADLVTYEYNYIDEYNLLEKDYMNLQERFDTIKDDKKAICEYKEPSINWLMGMMGLVFGFIGALWLLLIWDKKKILELMKKIKS